MSKTLFWYILKDLLRIFFFALGVLTGIISFCGLLKPMMESGLTTSQVLQILTYFTPAAQTYAMPIAALLATTMVYGRLAADNEITACRASGISYWTLTAPALILGLVLALFSLSLLCFIVPWCTLKVEKVAYASMADIIVKSIEREHRLKITGTSYVVYADSAERNPSLAKAPEEEVVILHNPMFCKSVGKPLAVPTEFYTARSATVVIRQNDSGMEVTFHLENGAKFPRTPEGTAVAAATWADVGPMPLPTPIRDNPKFMSIPQLQAFYREPTKHRDIRSFYESITADEQCALFLKEVADQFNKERALVFDAENGDVFKVTFERGMLAPRFEPTGSNPPRPPSRLRWISPTAGYDIRVRREVDGEVFNDDRARNLVLKVQADEGPRQMRLALVLEESISAIDEIKPQRQSISRVFSVPMNEDLLAIQQRGPEYYLKHGSNAGDAAKLRHKLPSIKAGIYAEIQARASFAVSAFILVLVGSMLGMLFKTGNFLSAFALAVIPAFLCIALMVTGQHVSEGADGHNLRLGVALVWSGDVIVGALAAGLLAYYRGQ